jgi:hypothetical protein
VLEPPDGENRRKAEKTGGERSFLGFGFTGVHRVFDFTLSDAGDAEKLTVMFSAPREK